MAKSIGLTKEYFEKKLKTKKIKGRRRLDKSDEIVKLKVRMERIEAAMHLT